jgi:hypothetical protein
MRRLWALVVAVSVVGLTATAWGQVTPPPAPPPGGEKAVEEAKDAKKEDKPKTFWDENTLFAYIENSFVGNLHGAGRGNRNELRFYDLDAGYTFNMAEFSIKKDPSEKYPFGYGLVLTAGRDAQKNHALGIFRSSDDTFAYSNTAPFDLQEAYGSYKIPIGEGLTLKAGKWVTLLGYEVIESPNDLNFSRSFMFSFGIPLTHVGALLSYPVADFLTVTAGTVVGWDVAKDNNSAMSFTGQFAATPIKDVALTFNWITGPEQNSNDTHNRTTLDFIAVYTGIKRLTLALNYDYSWENKDATLVASGTRDDTRASWWGIAGYGAWDWTESLRTAVRVEYFADLESVRTAARPAGNRTGLWETTATLQYKIWRGLVGRLEYRHDQANAKVFKLENHGTTPTRSSQDTLSVSLYYLFF